MSIKHPEGIQPPLAQKEPHQQTHHGITLEDDYHWLRAENWQEALKDPQVLPDDIKAYLTAENDYYAAVMKDTESLQKTLIEEMKGRMQDDLEFVPERWGDYDYNLRYDAGKEHPVHYRTHLATQQESILLDENQEAEAFDYFEVDEFEVSPEQNRLAWSRDTNGSEHYSLLIRDLATGQDLDYEIPDVSSVAWANEDILFYSKLDDNHRSSFVYRHQIGTNPANDVLIKTEDDPRFSIAVTRTLSGAFIFLACHTNDENENWYIPTNKPLTEPTLIHAREPSLEYTVDHQGDHFIIHTNADEAIDFKIMQTPVATPGRENWQPLIEHEQGTLILHTFAYQDWIIWQDRHNALPRINIRHNKGDTHQITFEEEAYALGVSSALEYDANEIRFSYSSPTTPTQSFDYHLIERSRTLRKEQIIPSGHNSKDYVTRRITAISHDGAEVPVTLLYHKNTKLDGTAPCYLYGYGSYGAAIPASFNANRLSLADRGFITATAHIRGGADKGRAWYESAKGEHKPNTFHDFIASAKHLITEGYTAKGRIVCSGASAGGLLIGAVVNMAPELFAGAEADVPFVDMLNTILDATLPLTPGEWTQWGNPIDSETAFHSIKSYSPYDNVCAQPYPTMLVTAGVSDPRVTYWEPAKWVAKLRQMKTDNNVLMLKTNMTSGHFGKTGRYAGLEDVALSYAFALKVTDSNT